ncbi:MAG: ABC transporter ATP-binding protein [Candidatus Heimdallarchaeota archaeon]|nr:ABC transporter ATP-binding protein [Candidatus Heimdallarchaeota archaeon]
MKDIHYIADHPPAEYKRGETILEFRNITKDFPGIRALDDISLEIREGEILAILGENGAGKSTLMKILSGLYQPDLGEIHINRNKFNVGYQHENMLVPIKFSDPRMAMKIGIGMVYQHFQLVDNLSVTDNITLGQEYTYGKSILINQKLSESKVEEIGQKYGMPIDPTLLIKDLPVGLRQRVEILKQLFKEAQLLILDEPTAVLTPTESKELFSTMRSLKKAGKSIIFISHKLNEPLAIADRIVAIRKGRIVGETFPSLATKEKLAEMVVGRKVLHQHIRQTMNPGRIMLDVQNLKVFDSLSKQVFVNDVSFSVCRNEIVGIAGVQGNGQSELVEAIMKLRKIDDGEVIIYNSEGDELLVSEKSTLDIILQGVGYIPEDRSVRGLILDFDVSENSWLAFQGNSEALTEDSTRSSFSSKLRVPASPLSNKFDNMVHTISDKLILPKNIMSKLAKKLIERYEIKTPSIHTPVSSLSGGNQQKVVIGRELAKNPQLIIASEPTRGVDIGVMEKVHEELINKRNEGAAILLISSDLDEVLSLSDRIIVMYEGKIAGMNKIEDFTMNEISQLMTTGEIQDKEVTA